MKLIQGRIVIRIIAAAVACLCMVQRGVAEPFTHAAPGKELLFPRDHGAHEDFQTEWWYFTGQLWRTGVVPMVENAQYGFQLTFFRRAGVGSGERPQVNQLYMAHGALSELTDQRFIFSKRLGSGLLGVAGAETGGLNAWNRGWRAQMIGGRIVLTYEIQNGEAEVAIRLLATPQKPLTLQGERGFSRKGECATCASHYYSYTRLKLEGEIVRIGRTGATREEVSGLGWMDHEFMSNALQADQAGWDWFSLILDKDTELMLFQLRKKESGVSFASATLVQDGVSTPLKPGEFELRELATWKSPHTGGVYPARWRVRVPRAEIDLEVNPLLADQEIHDKEGAKGEGISYWEGAVTAEGGGRRGVGYVEMTGYSKPLERNF